MRFATSVTICLLLMVVAFGIGISVKPEQTIETRLPKNEGRLRELAELADELNDTRRRLQIADRDRSKLAAARDAANAEAQRNRRAWQWAEAFHKCFRIQSERGAEQALARFASFARPSGKKAVAKRAGREIVEFIPIAGPFISVGAALYEHQALLEAQKQAEQQVKQSRLSAVRKCDKVLGPRK